MTKPKSPETRSYLRSFNYTDDGMAEVFELNVTGKVETGDYVRTSDYLLIRREAEAEIERLREHIKQLGSNADEPPADPAVNICQGCKRPMSLCACASLVNRRAE